MNFHAEGLGASSVPRRFSIAILSLPGRASDGWFMTLVFFSMNFLAP
jgi:hypothetical protein